jgi:hypothetical protein
MGRSGDTIWQARSPAGVSSAFHSGPPVRAYSWAFQPPNSRIGILKSTNFGAGVDDGCRRQFALRVSPAPYLKCSSAH